MGDGYVLVGYHGHQGVGELLAPVEFQREFARACIDGGADAFIGTGPHFLRGIEIYKGKPIFYGLGILVNCGLGMTSLPADAYDRFQLDGEATPADFIEARAPAHERKALAAWEMLRLREGREKA